MRLLTAQEIRAQIGCDFLVGGSSAIRSAGWTTQMQRMPELITRGPVPGNLEGVRLRPRPEAVFDTLLSWQCPIGYESDGLLERGSGWPVLMPEMAIADALVDRLRGGETHIYDPDDLDPEEMGSGAPDLFRQALAALGVEVKHVPLAPHYLQVLADEGEPGVGRVGPTS